MTTFLSLAREFLASEDGPTATEYAAMLGLIVLAAVGSIGGVGTKMDSVFNTLATSLPTGGGS